MIDSKGDIKLVDFGISRSLETLKEHPNTKCKGLSVYWTAPEVINPNFHPYTTSSDIWLVSQLNKNGNCMSRVKIEKCR